MSALSVVIVLVLVSLMVLLVLLLINKPNKEKFSNQYDQRGGRSILSKQVAFPLLPERMDELKDSKTKERLKKLSKCLDALQYEERIRDHVLKSFNQPTNQSTDQPIDQSADQSTNQPTDLSNISLLPIKDDCETCKELSSVWNLHISRVNNVKSFVRTGTVSITEPNEHPTKPCCINMDTVFKNYNKKLLKEVMCYVQNAKTRDFRECGNAGLPDEYGMDKNCQDCSSLYEKWFLYTSFLIDIQNYILGSGSGYT